MSAEQKAVAVMQPYFFPYIGYFQLIHAADVFVFYDDVNYINRGWVNRNNILLNGAAHLITLPLQGASQNRKINEIEVADSTKALGKLLKTIAGAYARAPQFPVVFPLLSEWLSREFSSIGELNRVTTSAICQFAGITTRLVESSAVYNNAQLKGQERILDICIQEQAAIYINPIGGVDLYSNALFEEKGIDLKFLRAEPQPYPQRTPAFIPYLSILDYLMFVPREELLQRLTEFSFTRNSNNP